MAKKMLIDAAQAEEVRVAIVQGNRVEDFEFESSLRKQLKGNIYLAKVTRIEPSLQAAFVEYGGNRHGFLPLSEIHPDYYQIPVEDREALLADEAREAAEAQAAEDAEDEEVEAKPKRERRPAKAKQSKSDEETAEEETAGSACEYAADIAPDEADEDTGEASNAPELEAEAPEVEADDQEAKQESEEDTEGKTQAAEVKDEVIEGPAADAAESENDEGADAGDSGDERTIIVTDEQPDDDGTEAAAEPSEGDDEEVQRKPRNRRRGGRGRRRGKKAEDGVQDAEALAEDAEAEAEADDAEAPSEVTDEGGADEVDEDAAFVERRRARRRHYRIQEVIRPRQILLVQVVKEERGTKGAALTTYLSLAGRYGVLMPNTARGGGISRKINNREDRKRLKGIVRDLEVSKGMGLIVRTAGAQRTRQEIKRDYDYLIRLWEQIRELTLKSVAPCLIYEEGSLLLRAIRDFYAKEVETVLVQGEAGYKEAKGYMKLLMPSHAKNVQRYKDDVPLFQRYQVDSQLEQMIEPEVQLKSGGYLVINPTEALVSIDINSGRSTREKNIEQTALRTNLEAAEEIARQLRLRDLAGLVVIDFIDMDENRNNKAVERKMKECLKNDRARIQVGRISQFGLLEMSRQRLGSSLLETAARTCPHCAGSGLLRTDDSAALSALRRIEEEALRGKASEIAVNLHPDVALYLLNHKRDQIAAIEERHDMRIVIAANGDKRIGECVIERLKARQAGNRNQRAVSDTVASPGAMDMDDPVDETTASNTVAEEVEDNQSSEDEGASKKRRRGRRGGRRRSKQNSGENTSEENTAESVAAEDGGEDQHQSKGEARTVEITESGDVENAVEAEKGSQVEAPKDESSKEEAPKVEQAKAEPEDVEPAKPAVEEEPASTEPTRKGWWQRRFGN